MVKKYLISFLMVFLFQANASAQVAPYIPMDLDTTSFWVMDLWWGGFPSFSGERICQVVGDTIILNKNYKTCECYTSKGRMQSSAVGAGALQFDKRYYLHEDTILKNVLIASNNGSTLGELAFRRNVGDTSSFFMNASLVDYPLIDSVKYETYLGNIARRTAYATHQFSNLFRSIEGVGASHNFPEMNWGEWGIPIATCRCYSKNGVVQYLDGIIADSCYKKNREKPFALSSQMLQNKLSLNYSFIDNVLSINNIRPGKISIKLISINGALLMQKDVVGSYTYSFHSLPTGVYVLSLRTVDSVENRKIIIK